MNTETLTTKSKVSLKPNESAISRKNRVEIVNEIIKEISNRGRKFFHHKGKVAELVDRGKIYYRAEYGDKATICVSIPDYTQPKGWFHGGTLWRLVQEFRDYINDGNKRECSGLYSPHWGYMEEDMKAIREFAIQKGFLIANNN